MCSYEKAGWPSYRNLGFIQACNLSLDTVHPVFFPEWAKKQADSFPPRITTIASRVQFKTRKNAENLVVNYNCSWTNSWRCCVIVEQKLHIGITNKLHSGYFRMQNASSVFDNWSR